MTPQILNRIEQMQAGKSGIYPYRVAQDIAAECRIPMHEAIEHVLYHIKIEMYGEVQS